MAAYRRGFKLWIILTKLWVVIGWCTALACAELELRKIKSIVLSLLHLWKIQDALRDICIQIQSLFIHLFIYSVFSVLYFQVVTGEPRRGQPRVTKISIIRCGPNMLIVSLQSSTQHTERGNFPMRCVLCIFLLSINKTYSWDCIGFNFFQIFGTLLEFWNIPQTLQISQSLVWKTSYLISISITNQILLLLFSSNFIYKASALEETKHSKVFGNWSTMCLFSCKWC